MKIKMEKKKRKITNKYLIEVFFLSTSILLTGIAEMTLNDSISFVWLYNEIEENK